MTFFPSNVKFGDQIFLTHFFGSQLVNLHIQLLDCSLEFCKLVFVWKFKFFGIFREIWNFRVQGQFQLYVILYSNIVFLYYRLFLDLQGVYFGLHFKAIFSVFLPSGGRPGVPYQRYVWSLNLSLQSSNSVYN